MKQPKFPYLSLSLSKIETEFHRIKAFLENEGIIFPAVINLLHILQVWKPVKKKKKVLQKAGYFSAD